MNNKFRKLGKYLALLFVLAALGVVTASAAPLADYNLDQCQNGPFGTPKPCNNQNQGYGWQNGNANEGNSHWREGDAIAYRLSLINLTTGAANLHTLIIQYDFTDQTSKHAIDYLTSYNFTETTNNWPCDGALPGNPCSSAPTNTFPIPDDPSVLTCPTPPHPGGVPIPAGQTLAIWNGTITGVTIASHLCEGADLKVSVTITFWASDPSAVIAWGGHIASSSDWGVGVSASALNGSPYHMRVLSFDGKGGNQDRSLQIGAVAWVNLSTQVSTPSGTLGIPLTDTVTVASGGVAGTLQGNLQFYICYKDAFPFSPPDANGCVSTGITPLLGLVAVDGNGTYSKLYTPTKNGSYCFRVEFTATNTNFPNAHHTNPYTTTTSGFTPECFVVNTPTAVSLSSFQAGSENLDQIALFGGAMALVAGSLYLILRRKSA